MGASTPPPTTRCWNEVMVNRPWFDAASAWAAMRARTCAIGGEMQQRSAVEKGVAQQGSLRDL